jgi:hypothetical protein
MRSLEEAVAVVALALAFITVAFITVPFIVVAFIVPSLAGTNAPGLRGAPAGSYRSQPHHERCPVWVHEETCSTANM